MITTINEFKKYNESIDLSKYVDEYLDNEFYINNYKYEENIDDDTDDEEIINDEEYKSWLKYDIKVKLDDINDIINLPLTLYRKISVDNNWFKQLKEYTKLGIYWSYESDAAETHWGYIDDKKPNLVELIITKINEFKQFINESNSNIRVSCASLAAIIIDGKYLINVNFGKRKSGNIVYTPFGGALEYKPDALPLFNEFNAQFERDTPDLRMSFDSKYLSEFKIWFNSKIDRETSIDRELYEELVTEENVFNQLSSNDYTTQYIKTVETTSEDTIKSYRFFEIYKISFNENKLDEILENLKQSNTGLYLADKNEILNGVTKTGYTIGENTKSILL